VALSVREPAKAAQRDEAIVVEHDPFGLEERALQPGVCFVVKSNLGTTCVLLSDDALPREIGRAVAHEARDHAVARRYPSELRHLTVGRYFAARDRANDGADLARPIGRLSRLTLAT
jgi:hypothetical protein